VSPITTFLRIVAVVEKPFTKTPASVVFMISLEWFDDTVPCVISVFNDLEAHEIYSKAITLFHHITEGNSTTF